MNVRRHGGGANAAFAAHPGDPPVCALCGAPLQPPIVATTTGPPVHRNCADRAAMQAWRRRRLWATVHGVVIVGVGIGVLVHELPAPLPFAVTFLAWLLLHQRLHWRTWHYLGRALRRWLLGRSTG